MDTSRIASQPPANDPGGEDIRQQLRRDHEAALAELDLLRDERDERRCGTRLRELRRAWIVHALAEETVVYRALDGSHGSSEGRVRADERFIEHEIVGSLFDKLSRSGARSLEWNARVNVLGELMRRHIEREQADLFEALGARFDDGALAEMGRRFTLARDKLLLLEEAKAA